MANTNVHKPNYHTHTKHKPIYIYTYRQKALKLLEIKKGPIDKPFIKLVDLTVGRE